MRQETLMRLKPKLVVQGEILGQVHFLISLTLLAFARLITTLTLVHEKFGL
jgi:hypothetical protein